MRLRKKRITEFQTMIFQWWKDNRRDLPWRHTHDPYRILISEVMLQQTQVLRVIPKYREFIKRFPTIKILAKASTAEILRVWKGMGYNRRALYLKKIATIGVFPKSEKELVKLPGVGIYTARALLVFAFQKDVAMVDTNIRQIITHYFFSGKIQKPSLIQEIADQLVPKGKSWEWHQALMDYGALKLPRVRIARNTVPFIETNRFIRGRIIDELRIKSYKKETCISVLSEKYNKKPEDITKQIEALIKDGLVSVRADVVQLPD